jgi:hypothetical protein
MAAFLSFPTTPVKGTSSEVELNLTALLEQITNADYDESDEVSRVLVAFKSNPGSQVKVLTFKVPAGYDGSSPLVAKFKTSQFAKDTFQIVRVVLVDFDGGRITLERAAIDPADLAEMDITLGGAAAPTISFPSIPAAQFLHNGNNFRYGGSSGPIITPGATFDASVGDNIQVFWRLPLPDYQATQYGARLSVVTNDGQNTPVPVSVSAQGSGRMSFTFQAPASGVIVTPDTSYLVARNIVMSRPVDGVLHLKVENQPGSYPQYFNMNWEGQEAAYTRIVPRGARVAFGFVDQYASGASLNSMAVTKEDGSTVILNPADFTEEDLDNALDGGLWSEWFTTLDAGVSVTADITKGTYPDTEIGVVGPDSGISGVIKASWIDGNGNSQELTADENNAGSANTAMVPAGTSVTLSWDDPTFLREIDQFTDEYSNGPVTAASGYTYFVGTNTVRFIAVLKELVSFVVHPPSSDNGPVGKVVATVTKPTGYYTVIEAADSNIAEVEIPREVDVSVEWVDADPVSGYSLKHFVVSNGGNDESTSNPTSFSIGADASQVQVMTELNTPATFKVLLEEGITDGAGIGGGLSVVQYEGVDYGAASEHDFPQGASLSFIATPDAGMTFKHWNVASNDDAYSPVATNPLDVTLTSDMRAQAVFEPDAP